MHTLGASVIIADGSWTYQGMMGTVIAVHDNGTVTVDTRLGHVLCYVHDVRPADVAGSDPAQFLAPAEVTPETDDDATSWDDYEGPDDYEGYVSGWDARIDAAEHAYETRIYGV